MNKHFEHIDRKTGAVHKEHKPEESNGVKIQDIQELLQIYEQTADETKRELKEIKATMFVNWGGGNEVNPTLVNKSMSALEMFIAIIHHYYDRKMVHLPNENAWFPLGSFLTSKENGELVIAPVGAPREEIVGQVTFDGLNTKPYIPDELD